MRSQLFRRFFVGVAVIVAVNQTWVADCRAADDETNQVLEWNQILIDTLIQSNAVNAASPRLSAIVHTAMFDAYNGIERRYTPVYVHDSAPRGASRRAAVIAAAYTTLYALFPSRRTDLEASYAASLAALSDDEDDTGGHGEEHGAVPGKEPRGACAVPWRLP